jgi:hypothetical protein
MIAFVTHALPKHRLFLKAEHQAGFGQRRGPTYDEAGAQQ